MEHSTPAEALIPRFKLEKILNQGLQSLLSHKVDFKSNKLSQIRVVAE